MTDKIKPVSEARKFTTDIIWVALAQILTQALGIITLPALTKNYSTELYGVWTQIGVTVGLLTPIVILHFSTAVVRYLAAEESKEKRRQDFSAMLWPVVILATVSLVIAILFKTQLSTFIFASPEYETFVILAFLWVCTSSLYNFSISYLRARGKIKKLSLINMVFSLSKMLVIVVCATAGLQLEWITIGTIGTELVLVVILFAMVIADIGFPTLRIAGLGRFAAFSIPQIPSGILLWIISASDRYFITHLLDLSQAGIYSASYSVGSLVTLFYSPISFVLLPLLSKFWENNQQERVKTYLEYSNKLFLTLAIPASIGLFILARPLLNLLAKPEYFVSGELVLLIAIGVIFLGIYQINLYIMYLLQKTKWLPFMILIAAAINAGINIVLIPQVGIIGAAISTIVAYFILAAIVTIWARNAIHYKLDIFFIGKAILATFVMSGVLWFIPVEGVLGIILMVVGGVIVYVACLFALRAFSKQDLDIVREIIRR